MLRQVFRNILKYFHALYCLWTMLVMQVKIVYLYYSTERAMNSDIFTVFALKPWTPEKISKMLIVSPPIRCEMKPQNITAKPQRG